MTMTPPRPYRRGRTPGPRRITRRPLARPRRASPAQRGGPPDQVRAITAGEAAAQWQPDARATPTANESRLASVAGPADDVSVPDVPPEHMYGPDDPGYGPPGD